MLTPSVCSALESEQSRFLRRAKLFGEGQPAADREINTDVAATT
jgi:hypothetical protein